MSGTLTASTTDSSHANTFKTASKTESKMSTWLVISHDDPRLLNKLELTLHDESATLLAVPQSDWQAESGKLQESIEAALKESKVSNLLIVGHSEASPTSKVQSVPANASKPFLSGAANGNVNARNCQEAFIGQVQKLLQIPSIRRQLELGELAINALYYRSQIAMFLELDFETGELKMVAQ